MGERSGSNARRYAETRLDKDEILSSFEKELRKLIEESV
jgi:hypothetical protein